MNCEMTTFEREVMTMLLSGEDTVLCTLRQQLSVSQVKGRELTGTGFFTTFLVPKEAPRVSGQGDFHLGNVIAKVDGLENGAGFVLFVKNGAIDFLEGYSYDEAWPNEIKRFKLAHSEEMTRGSGLVLTKCS